LAGLEARIGSFNSSEFIMLNKILYRSLALVATLVLAAEPTGPVQAVPAKENYVAFCAGADTDGPEADCVHALKIGPANALRVLVLVPGGSEGAESLREVGRHLSNALPDTQVWAFDRRQQNLIDSSRFGGDSELDYYLKGQYHQVTAENASDTRDWGLAMCLSGLRRVILAAATGGRQVWLGGHSWGATTSLAYAAWDFDGHPGFRDLAGLILIDGGAHGSFDGEGYTVAKISSVQEVEKKLDAIKTGVAFSGDLGFIWQLPGAPESVPIYYQLAADYALRNPHGASPLQPLLPQSMQPPLNVTNAALLGWLLDAHAPAPDLRAHSGHVDTSNVPVHDWVADGPADMGDLAAIFAHSRPAALEWYWPRRLTLDLTAIDPFADSPVTRALGLRLTHAADIDVPLYVFATGITHGTVISSSQWVVANTKIHKVEYVTDDSMAHLDPLYDRPDHNKFIQTLVKFLQESATATQSAQSGK
jgi:pimeloyl-ACP methyl ester carboxylesterase